MTSAKWHNSPVLIAGGGIGGLSAALALAERGIPCHVLEADATFNESGAGIQIGPNGSRILHEWGLGDTLDRRGGKPDVLTIGDGLNGKLLTEIPLGAATESRYGAPYYVAERAQLHRLLREKAEQCSQIILATNVPVLSLRTIDSGIAAMSADGREVEGAALIGADGVHSQVRLQLFGRRPRPSGRKAWRATAPLQTDGADIANKVQLWLSPHGHLVHYRCGPNGPLNAVAITRGDTNSESWGNQGEAHDLKAHFAEWHDHPYGLLQNFDNWMCWPLLEMEPLPYWSEGCITLLGDAAHPIMPFLASGAVMAIEDAATLAAELACNPNDPAAAFRLYERRRRSRIARVRRGAEQTGAIYHMDGPLRLARNLTLHLMSPARLLARNDWLYAYCAGSL